MLLFTLLKTVVELLKSIGAVLFTVIEFKLVQLANAFAPIVVTDDGMVTDNKLEHNSKASKPIEVIEVGIVTDFKPVQFINV